MAVRTSFLRLFGRLLLGVSLLMPVVVHAESCRHLDTLPFETPHVKGCGFGFVEQEGTFHAYGHDYYYALVDRASGVVWLDFYLYVKDSALGEWRLILLRANNKSNLRIRVEDSGLKGEGFSGETLFFIAAEGLK